MDVSCVLVHARCISSHKTDAYIVFFFEIMGRSMHADDTALSE